MPFIHITAIRDNQDADDFIIGGNSIEGCFGLLSKFVSLGCQLITVKLSLGEDCLTFLPIEAFDGEPMEEAIQVLQREWEAILFTNKNSN
ncbi:hypothetical protein GCM10027592_29820 [Spirosoma flavus]